MWKLLEEELQKLREALLNLPLSKGVEEVTPTSFFFLIHEHINNFISVLPSKAAH